MKFHCVTLPEQLTTNNILKKACEIRDIEFCFSNLDCSISNTDLVYRVSDGSHSNVLKIEKKLLDSGGVSFYRDWKNFLYDRSSDFDSTVLSNSPIPIPKFIRIFESSKINSDVIDSIGGYPLVLKVLGGSHGVGVIKVDSATALVGLADYFINNKINFVLKEFVEGGISGRLIVLGKKVIGSIEYFANSSDFRSNSGKNPNVRAMEYPEYVQKMAINAVSMLGLDFGGVDVLFGARGPLVAEINFPCFFPRVQILTGIDVAGQMIEYLVEKSKLV